MMKHVNYFLLVLLFAIGVCTLNAQQYTTGDTFTYTNTDGVEKTYKVVGENLIANPSFESGVTGWTGGAGGELEGVDWHPSGGVDDGAYLRLVQNAGKGSNGSIGTTWTVEMGKTYVFSCFMRNNSDREAENPAGDCYIKTSISDVPYDGRCVLLPYPHVDADLSWTQNTLIVTAEYSFLSFSARWLAGTKCFDSFILAEVEELPNPCGLKKLLAECNDVLLAYENPKGGYDFQRHIAAASSMLASFDSYSVKDVNKMIDRLKDALFVYRIKNADEEHPVDVTSRYLRNTKFESFLSEWNKDGEWWNFGHPYVYFEEQANLAFAYEYTSGAEGTLSQTAYNLPKGYYRFSVQCVMDHAIDVDNSNESSGAMIFCNGEELDMVPKQATKRDADYDNSHPERFAIETYVSSDSVVMGFKDLPDANFSYIAIDNVKLECLGIDEQSINPQYGIDVTNLLENPDFENSAVGWTIVGGNKIAATAATYGYNGTNFIENWVAAPSTLGDQSWSQTIEVPNGVYAIKSMAHAVLQSDASVLPSGVVIYANKDEVSVTTTHTNPPAEYSLVTVVTDGKLTIGYRITNCNINWAAWDNVRVIRYDAETTNDGLVMYAKDEMNELAIVAEDLLANKLQTSLANDLTSSIANIEEVLFWTEAKSLWETFKEQISEAKKSISAYKTLKEKIDFARSWRWDIGVSEFNMAVADAEAIYDEAILGVEEINAAGAMLDDAVLTYFKQNADGKRALDVSDRYITNPTLRKGSEGWEGTKPMLEHEVMEFFCSDFDMYQHLSGLTNGLYVLSVQGFYDAHFPGGGGEAYNNGTETVKAELYANSSSSSLVSLYKYKASEMGIYDNEGVTNDYLCRRKVVDMAFNTINPLLRIPYYAENTLEVFVKDGNLTIGLRGEKYPNNSWCAFRDFKLEYYGDLPYAMLERWVNNSQKWLDKHVKTLPRPAYKELASRIEIIREGIVSNTYTYDEALVKIDECENLFFNIQLVPDLVKQLRDILLQIEELLFLEYPGADALLAEHKKAIPLVKNAADFELQEGQTTVAYYHEVINRLRNAINVYCESQNATLDHPADFTHRIVLPNFTLVKSTSIPAPWVVDNVYNGNSKDVWVGPCRPQEPGGETVSGLNSWAYDFTSMNVYQDLVGIPNGIYSVSAEAITQELGGQHVYAKSANDMAVSPNMSVDGWDTYEWETLMTEQILVADGKLRIGFASTSDGDTKGWFQVTGFKLHYYGKPEGMDKYQVSYMIDGEVVHTDLVDCGSEILYPQAPIKEGYTFIGWEGPKVMPAEDVVMIGKYAVNSYNIKYIADGVVYHEATVEFGSTITPPTSIPEKEGYTFVGWSNCPATMPAADIVTSAIFKINKYCITYLVDDVVVATDSVTYGSYIVPIDVPIKEGHTFIEWDGMPIVMPADDITIRATFVVNEYLVTFKIDGNIITSELLEYGAKITAPNAPEREGYTFSGWGEVAETVPASDVVYDGIYSVNLYLLTFVVDGETVKEDSVAYGSSITLPEDPMKEGHSFNGWIDIPETMPANDVMVAATFSVNKYIVTFMIDGVVIASNELEYGSTINVPSMPDREGYTFSGWCGVDKTVPAYDVTYNASYIANVYKVYYFVGAILVHTIDVAYGETMPEYVYEPTIEGDEFLGWIGETYTSMPAHDVTYTANIVNGINHLITDDVHLTIYDLSGRKMQVEDLRELEKGVYMVNGKKIVIDF